MVKPLGKRQIVPVLVLLVMGLVWLSALTTSALAQTASGGVRGAVLDQNGAAVAGASVTAKNIATGIESKTTTTGEGVYSIARLLPGKYVISVEARGFKRAEYTDVDVTAGRDVVIDAKLEPGAISETVTVTAGAELLVEKDTAQVSATFQERKIHAAFSRA